MHLTTYLRKPMFVTNEMNLDELKARLKQEEHPFVFVKQNGKIYAIKSIALLLESAHPIDWLKQQSGQTVELKILAFDELAGHVLDVYSQEVTLVNYRDEIKYFRREDYLLSILATGTDADLAWLRTLLSTIPRGLLVVGQNYTATNINTEALRMLRMSAEEMSQVSLDHVFGTRAFEYVQTTQTPLLNQVITTRHQKATLLVDFAPLVIGHEMTGFVLVLQDLPTVEGMAMELHSVKHLNQDLEAILSSIYDEIIVVDSRGVLLRASNHFIATNWDSPPNTLIGESVFDLKVEDDIICRVIREVQNKKQKVSLMHNGQYPVLSVGNPMYTDDPSTDRIVIASRDLTEVARLQGELEKTRRQGESYRQQLEILRERIHDVQGTRLVYASPLMDEVMEEVERVAQFETTVLLVGESGVGKEVIADLIHSLSERRDKPFIKINCAAIPESLLESELFGYEKGAFSGANQQGKKGLFIKADKGTLFLDEISELPLGLQVKLLRALQERQVYPVGGTTPVTFDVQLIAATNRRLEQLVAERKFREDLFYRINVYPIEIPPLRDRKADIAVLVHHFLFQLNQTYHRSLRFSSGALELLEAYDFPGNVRQLQNVVNRAAIRSEGEVIDVSVVEKILTGADYRPVQDNKRFQQVIPLRRAIEQVEEDLIVLAMNRYHSTTLAAKALGINQSTVSRKYRQIVKRRDRTGRAT